MSNNNISQKSREQECSCGCGQDCACGDHHDHKNKNKNKNNNTASTNSSTGTDTDSSNNNTTVAKDTHTQDDTISSTEEEPASILSQEKSTCCSGNNQDQENIKPKEKTSSCCGGDEQETQSSCCGGDEQETQSSCCGGDEQETQSSCCGGDEQETQSSCCGGDEQETQSSCCGGDEQEIQSSCCGGDEQELQSSCCGGGQANSGKNKKKKLWINRNKFTFYGTMILILFTILHELENIYAFKTPLDVNFTISTFANHSLSINLNFSNLSNHMAEVFLTALPGLIVGIIAVGFLGMIPREFILSIMGTNKGRTQALCRAMIAGLLFDLCNHGLMMVAVTLYRKGAKMSHVMAFLISSPWNSFSVTIMMFIFLGWKATVLFLIVSLIASFIIGFIVDILENHGAIPSNPVSSHVNKDFDFIKEAKVGLKALNYDRKLLKKALRLGIAGSTSVVKWTVFGLIFSAIVSTIIPTDIFHEYFGRSVKGFILVFIVSILLEVCSQGTVPIAGNIFKKAHALGNSFLFLNVGAITNITQILVLNDLTKSKKATAILVIVPLIVVVIFSILLNFVIF